MSYNAFTDFFLPDGSVDHPGTFTYICRAEVAIDYLSFLRLPYRERKRFKDIADEYYENLKKKTRK